MAKCLLSPLRGDLCVEKHSLNHFHHQQGVARKAVDSSCNCWLKNWCSALHIKDIKLSIFWALKPSCGAKGCTLCTHMSIGQHPLYLSSCTPAHEGLSNRASKQFWWHLIRSRKVFYSWRIFVEWKRKKSYFNPAYSSPPDHWSVVGNKWESKYTSEPDHSPSESNLTHLQSGLCSMGINQGKWKPRWLAFRKTSSTTGSRHPGIIME